MREIPHVDRECFKFCGPKKGSRDSQIAISWELLSRSFLNPPPLHHFNPLPGRNSICPSITCLTRTLVCQHVSHTTHLDLRSRNFWPPFAQGLLKACIPFRIFERDHALNIVAADDCRDCPRFLRLLIPATPKTRTPRTRTPGTTIQEQDPKTRIKNKIPK